MADYLDYRESVKMLRDSLHHNFPGVRFSVAKTYRHGTSVRVSYTFVPPASEVDRVAQRFHGRDFDGMTDSNSYPSTLLADATGNVREVRNGIGFIFTERNTPESYFVAVIETLGNSWEPKQWPAMSSFDKSNMAGRCICLVTTREDEPTHEVAERAVAAYFQSPVRS